MVILSFAVDAIKLEVLSLRSPYLLELRFYMFDTAEFMLCTVFTYMHKIIRKMPFMTMACVHFEGDTSYLAQLNCVRILSLIFSQVRSLKL